MPRVPTLSLTDLARLIDQPTDALAAYVEPAEGLRVWGHTGISTVHHAGKIRLAVLHRRLYRVEDRHDHTAHRHRRQPDQLGSYAP